MNSLWVSLAPQELRNVRSPLSRFLYTFVFAFLILATALFVMLVGASLTGCTPITSAACPVINVADNVCELLVATKDPDTGKTIYVKVPAAVVRTEARARASGKASACPVP